MIDEENWGACFNAARAAGYSMAQAEECDDGSLGCPACPWAATEGELCAICGNPLAAHGVRCEGEPELERRRRLT
jgi:hypothetical protein